MWIWDDCYEVDEGYILKNECKYIIEKTWVLNLDEHAVYRNKKNWNWLKNKELVDKGIIEDKDGTLKELYKMIGYGDEEKWRKLLWIF